MTRQEAINEAISTTQSNRLRRKIEEELILKERLEREAALLPPSAIWHGKHKPYGAWNEEIHY